ncbi:MAG: hypothetical protein HPY67_03965 [Syntrophaceae bacterium]|nr:hypothetical protein [Syntrophaceae bacterium]
MSTPVKTRNIQDLTREELLGFLEDASLNWLAHDGLWFQAVERRYGTDVGRQCSGEAIGAYSEIEAKRILKRFELPTDGGIPVLMQALRFRMYHLINKQDFVEVSETRCIFRMRECRVQAMRRKKGLPDYPCKTTGIAEYSRFASAVDPRIKTRCVACPPDAHPEEFWCAWEFSIDK